MNKSIIFFLLFFFYRYGWYDVIQLDFNDVIFFIWTYTVYSIVNSKIYRLKFINLHFKWGNSSRKEYMLYTVEFRMNLRRTNDLSVSISKWF